MGVSSHWGFRALAIACACLGALLSGPGPAAAVGRAAPAVARVTAMPRPQPRAIPSVRAGDFGRGAAGRRRGYGGLGLAGLGLGVAGYGLDAGDGLGGGYGGPPAFGPDAPPMLPPPVFLPLPPACPLIIRVGRGLAHPVRTQVVYGRPVCRR